MMLKTHLRQLGIAFISALPLTGLLSQSSLAQRNDADLTAFLLNGADCVVSASEYGYDRLNTETEPVSINHQVFERLFSIGASDDGGSASISCRANSRDFGLVDLRMGVTDGSAQSGANMTINVYQGGNLRHTYKDVQAGSLISVLFDLNAPEIANNPDSFAVEIFNCTDINNAGNRCNLQFVEARLYPAGSINSFSGNGSASLSSPQAPASTQGPVPPTAPIVPTPAPVIPTPSSSPVVPAPTQEPVYDPSHPKPPWR
ncbi:MAG: hypothetical protein ABG776_02555 [Cyanobacteria bacterium J06555_13]